MFYKIIKKTGVLETGTPFNLDEENELVLSFSNLPDGELYASVSDGRMKKIIVKILDGKAVIRRNKIFPGIWYVEVLKVENGQYVDKIVCTPITLISVAKQTTGLIAYPEMESVLSQIAELTEIVHNLSDWAQKVSPLIHEHKIIK